MYTEGSEGLSQLQERLLKKKRDTVSRDGLKKTYKGSPEVESRTHRAIMPKLKPK
jgi:hypothetical protein